MDYEKILQDPDNSNRPQVLASAGLHIYTAYLMHNINSMSRDLNDAKRPEKAFQTFFDQTPENPNNSKAERKKIREKITGKGLRLPERSRDMRY